MLSIPLDGVRLKPIALHADDAEPLTRRRSHDDPTLHARIDDRPKFLEPGDLGWDVVGLDIEMNAAFVIDALELDADLTWSVFQHHVIAARARMVRIDRTAERLRPELRGRLHVIDVAVDQDAVDARTMYWLTPTR